MIRYADNRVLRKRFADYTQAITWVHSAIHRPRVRSWFIISKSIRV
jgi:hypothetical protein